MSEERLKKILEWSDIFPSDCEDILNYVNKLQQETQQLKEIEKEHQKINGELREENKKLKEVIEEIREYAKEHRYYAHTIDVDELLQILDKTKGEMNNE